MFTSVELAPGKQFQNCVAIGTIPLLPTSADGLINALSKIGNRIDRRTQNRINRQGLGIGKALIGLEDTKLAMECQLVKTASVLG